MTPKRLFGRGTKTLTTGPSTRVMKRVWTQRAMIADRHSFSQRRRIGLLRRASSVERRGTVRNIDAWAVTGNSELGGGGPPSGPPRVRSVGDLRLDGLGLGVDEVVHRDDIAGGATGAAIAARDAHHEDALSRVERHAEERQAAPTRRSRQDVPAEEEVAPGVEELDPRAPLPVDVGEDGPEPGDGRADGAAGDEEEGLGDVAPQGDEQPLRAECAEQLREDRMQVAETH